MQSTASRAVDKSTVEVGRAHDASPPGDGTQLGRRRRERGEHLGDPSVGASGLTRGPGGGASEASGRPGRIGGGALTGTCRVGVEIADELVERPAVDGGEAGEQGGGRVPDLRRRRS